MFLIAKRSLLLLLTLSLVLLIVAKSPKKNKLMRYLSECNTGGPVLGFEGKCKAFSIPDIDKYLPAKIKDVWTKLTGKIKQLLPGGLKGCIGDFTPKQFEEEPLMEETMCSFMPFSGDKKFAVAGILLPQLPCGAPIAGVPSPVDAALCIAFDRCGTFSVTANLGVAACIASYSGAAATGGITTFLATFHDVVNTFGFGFSVDRHFEKEVTIGVLNGNSIENKNLDVRGSAYFKLGLAIPNDFLKFTDKVDLTKLFEFDVEITYLIDVGDVRGALQSMNQELEIVKDSDKAKTVVNHILGLGRQLVTSMDGNMNINLEDLTKGIIPDIAITLNKVTSIISRGKGGDLPAGYYFTTTSEAVQDLCNTINGFIEAYEEIFSKLGIGKIEVPVIDITFSYILTADMLAIKSVFPGSALTCLFRWASFELSCSYNSLFFSMIKEGAQYVFREAKKFFENTGRVLKNVAVETFKKFTRGISEGVRKIKGMVKVGGEWIKVNAKKFANFVKDLKDKAIQKAKEIAEAAKKKAEEAIEAAKKAANDAIEKAKKLANEVKKKAEQGWCYTRYFYSSSKTDRCLEEVDRKYN